MSGRVKERRSGGCKREKEGNNHRINKDNRIQCQTPDLTDLTSVYGFDCQS